MLPRGRMAAVVPVDDVIAQVRDAANWTGSTGPARYMVASTQPNATFYAAEGGDDPYAPIGARGVPENFTLLPKTTSQTSDGASANGRTTALTTGRRLAQ